MTVQDHATSSVKETGTGEKIDTWLTQPDSRDVLAWQPIETAIGDWIIGYTSWGQHVGAFHEWVGPCERYKDHYEFVNTDFDAFPRPTHWMPLPAPPRLEEGRR